jgi:hypothetical protein
MDVATDVAGERPDPAPSPRWAVTGAIALGGALLWGLLIAIRLGQVPFGWWRWRDDAVITLSHAKNLVDHGTIGLSPGGNRVEGYSSPLQFAIACVFFFLTGAGYETFLDLQSIVCVLLIGALVTLLPFLVCRRAGLSGRDAYVASFVTSGAVLVVVVSSWSTIGWLVSGMENPYAIVLGLSMVLWIGRGLRRGRDIVVAGVLLGLFGLVRVEFAFFMVPFALAFGVIAARDVKSITRVRAVALAWGVPGAIWLVSHLLRYWYFGSFQPNTALAQNKEFGSEQVMVLLNAAILFIFGMPLLDPHGAGRKVAPRYGAALGCVLFVGWAAFLQSKGAGFSLPLVVHFNIVLALIVAAGVLAIAAAEAAEPGGLGMLLAGLAWVPISQYVVMGPARLAEYRVLTIAVPFLAVAAALAALRLWIHHLSRLPFVAEPREAVALSNDPGAAPAPRNPARTNTGLVKALAMPVALLMIIAGVDDTSRKLPVIVTPHDTMILEAAAAFRDDRLAAGALPIVANPDLGKLSFAKEAIIVDLGRLGDPLLTRLFRNHRSLSITYLGKVAVPDVVETHGVWSCAYKEWLTTDGFISGWSPFDPSVLAGLTGDEECPTDSRFTIWVRTSGEDEFELTRAIAHSDAPAAVVTAAVSNCVAADGDVWRCEYVRRAITRNSPRLHEGGQLGDVTAALERSPTFELDRELLLQQRGWDKRAEAAFVALAG